MQILPQDLGKHWHVATVRYRAMGTARIVTQPEIGRLGRLWIRGMKSDPDVLAATLPMMADQTGPLVSGLGTLIGLCGIVLLAIGHLSLAGVALVLMLAAFAFYVASIVMPRRNFRRLHSRPVTWEEVEALKGSVTPKEQANQAKATPPRGPVMKLFQSLKGAAPIRPGDTLEREYLNLVQDALAIQNLSQTAQFEVKRVLQSVGEAVAALPPAKVAGEDSFDVAGDAEMLAARALREGDTVVAASLLRQADANLARARALENNKLLARRTHVLRDEMIAQVKAVRSLLPALSSDATMAATDFGRFASVSASVQSIASEAVSVEAARTELAQELFPEFRVMPVLTDVEAPRLELRR